MIPPHTKAISKQNTLFRAPQHGRGCFVLAKNELSPPQCVGVLGGNVFLPATRQSLRALPDCLFTRKKNKICVFIK
jgi:hypothetical protein